MPKIKLLVDGGKMAPGPAVAQQLGPMGINMGKVIADVNEATKSFAGTKVPVELDVDPKTKNYEISVSTPPVSELIKKELKIEKGSGESLKIKVGNVSIETLIKIAKTKESALLARNLKSGLKLVVGTCVSLGVLVDNKEPNEVQKEIDEGHYDQEIKEGRTEASPEKLEKLQKFFAVRKAKQEKDKKAAEEAEAAEEAAKVAKAAEGAATPAAAATGAATAEAKPAEAAKPAPEKK